MGGATKPAGEGRTKLIQTALFELAVLAKSEESMARLHEIERMMVRDVLAEPRHLTCSACLRWMRRLISKAKGEEA